MLQRAAYQYLALNHTHVAPSAGDGHNLPMLALRLLRRGIWICRTSQKVNEMLGNINTSGALAAFEKMEEKGRCCVSYCETIHI